MAIKNHYHKTGRVIFICFMLTWTYILISILVLSITHISRTDHPDSPTMISKFYKMGYEFSEAMFILGCTLTGAALAEKSKTIASSGFTMLAIAHGVFFASTFDADPDNYEKAVEIFVSGLLIFLPAMIMVSVYEQFPRWLRYLGIISCVPFLGNAYLYLINENSPKYHEPIGGIGLLFLCITATCWGIRINKILTQYVD